MANLAEMMKTVEEMRGQLSLNEATRLAVSEQIIDYIKTTVRPVATPQNGFYGMAIVLNPLLPDRTVVGLKSNNEVAFIWKLDEHPLPSS